MGGFEKLKTSNVVNPCKPKNNLSQISTEMGGVKQFPNGSCLWHQVAYIILPERTWSWGRVGSLVVGVSAITMTDSQGTYCKESVDQPSFYSREAGNFDKPPAFTWMDAARVLPSMSWNSWIVSSQSQSQFNAMKLIVFPMVFPIFSTVTSAAGWLLFSSSWTQ